MILILSSPVKVLAQDHWIPKNSVGAFAGIEWNTVSGLTGVTYERSLLKRDKITLGLVATYIFNYENGGMEIFSDSYDGQTTIATLMTTAHVFTSNSNQNNEGFFLLFGAGGGSRKHTENGFSTSRLLFCSEIGIGWQFYLGRKITFKLNSL